ncbi:MAG: hypothetical protein JO010_04550 [Alphaproteobacteria bacterium]|nr:hypothetical protein [Alphaproteobacteria bacterium]
MKRFFTAHPASVGETYAEHFVFALGIGSRMVVGGLACMLHGIIPELCQTTGSRTIRALALRLVPGNRKPPSRPPIAVGEPLFTSAELESLTSASL